MADNFKYVAGKDYRLATGVTSTATEITLSDLTSRAGDALTMTDFGTVGYATIAPGGSNMELISFTGITGTQLTGVTRGLKFEADYTADATLRNPHSAGTILRFTNTPQFYDQFVGKNNDETVNGRITFDGDIPQVGTYVTPTLDEELAAKKYVDDTAFAGAPDATTTSKGVVELATDTEAEEGTDTGSTTASLVTLPSQLLASQQKQVVTGVTYGDTITAGQWLYIDTADAKWKLADASAGATAGRTIGIALDSGVDTDTGKRVQIGGYVTGLSGLTVGTQYVSDTAGDISNTPGTYEKVVGFAPDATSVLITQTFSPGLLEGSNANSTTDNYNEAMDFFASTDFTASEAETLTDGSDASALHFHADAPFFATHVGDTGALQFIRLADIACAAISPDEDFAYILARDDTNASIRVYRMTRDTFSGIYSYDGTNVTLADGTYGWQNGSAGITVGDTYVWVCGVDGGASDIGIVRLDDDLTNPTQLTISGTSTTSALNTVAGDDSTIYVYGSSVSTTDVRIYTISGTTATRQPDITMTGASSGTSLYTDGTFLYLYIASDGDDSAIEKYPVAGGSQTSSTPVSLGYLTNTNLDTNAYSNIGLGVCGQGLYGITMRKEDGADDGTTFEFTKVAKP